MKNLIYSALIVLTASFGYSQNNSQNNETINNGRIIGSFELGSQEVTTILDESTDCVRKTSPHTKGLFTPNENVEIILKENKQSAEVRKPALPEKVWANKQCDFSFSVSNPLNSNDSIGRIHNELLSDFMNDIVSNNQGTPVSKEIVYDYFNADSTQIYFVEHLDEIPDSKSEEVELLPNVPFDVKYPEALKLLYDLNKIVYNEGLNLEMKINKIKQLEGKLLSNNIPEYLRNVPSDDIERVKSVLLSATSVGRYSLYFWTPIDEGGLGNTGYASRPPDWVYADLKAAAVSYWFAWNPFALLASTAISSALSTVW